MSANIVKTPTQNIEIDKKVIPYRHLGAALLLLTTAVAGNRLVSKFFGDGHNQDMASQPSGNVANFQEENTSIDNRLADMGLEYKEAESEVSPELENKFKDATYQVWKKSKAGYTELCMATAEARNGRKVLASAKFCFTGEEEPFFDDDEVAKDILPDLDNEFVATKIGDNPNTPYKPGTTSYRINGVAASAGKYDSVTLSVDKASTLTTTLNRRYDALSTGEKIFAYGSSVHGGVASERLEVLGETSTYGENFINLSDPQASSSDYAADRIYGGRSGGGAIDTQGNNIGIVSRIVVGKNIGGDPNVDPQQEEAYIGELSNQLNTGLSDKNLIFQLVRPDATQDAAQLQVLN